MRARFTRWLDHPRFVLFVAAFSLLLGLPSFASRPFADDWLHAQLANGTNPFWGAQPFALYSFFPRESDVILRLTRAGSLPWWTSPDLAIDLFRPLASISLSLDTWFFSEHLWLARLHQCLWFALLLVSAWRVLQRWVELPVAKAAFALYALAGFLGMGQLWLAARHGVLGATFAFFAFAAWLDLSAPQASPQRVVRGAFVGLGSALLGLLSSETSLGLYAMILAHVVLSPRDARLVRAKRALPFAALAIAYLAFYATNHFGAHGSGAYLDLRSDPLGSVAMMFVRVFVLVGESINGLSADLASHPVVLVASFVLGLLSVAWMARVHARVVLDEVGQRTARIAFLGGLLALLPTTQGLLGGRLLIFAGLPLMVPLAQILVASVRSAEPAGVAKAGAFVVATHVALGPLGRLALAFTFYAAAERTVEGAHELEALCASRTPLILRASDPIISMYTPMAASAMSSRPREVGVMSMSPSDHVLRADAHALTLEPVDRDFLSTPWEHLYRRDDMPLGERVLSNGITFHLEPGERRTRIRGEFEGEAPCLLDWHDGHYREVPWPSEGEAIEIAFQRGPLSL